MVVKEPMTPMVRKRCVSLEKRPWDSERKITRLRRQEVHGEGACWKVLHPALDEAAQGVAGDGADEATGTDDEREKKIVLHVIDLSRSDGAFGESFK